MADDSDLPYNCTVNPGDTAWVISASVLVLGMVPGLALFEAGLLRARHSISVYAQVVAGVLVLSMMWNVVGFSLTFGDTLGGVIGNPASYPFFLNIREGQCLNWAPNIPGYVFALFQMMFAAVTPLLQTGSYAERLKFFVFLPYTILWELFVYYPLAHWIWGGGWLAPRGPLFGEGGVIDFAGGITIHTSAGASALLASYMIGRRRGFKENNGHFRSSNLSTSLIGCTFLWIGWFGFNAGSALSASATAANAVVNTQLGACVCGTVWLVLHYIHHRKASLVELMNGTIAGLAGITPCSGFINPEFAFAVSLILGISSYYGVIGLKAFLKIDDALDVSIVHGLTGAVGALANGFFSSLNVNENGQPGWIDGNPKQIGLQLLGVVVAAVWGSIWTFILLKILGKCCGGIRVDEETETNGLGYGEHGEYVDDAYYFLKDKTADEREYDHGSVQVNSSVPPTENSVLVL